jgi:beta-glucosidase
MSGIADLDSPEAIAVQAVKAGVDILLMPIDPIATIHAICEAVESKEIDRDRIRASVQRIWRAKQKVCGIPPNLTKLGNPKNLDIAKAIAIKSINVFSSLPDLESSNIQKHLDANYLNLIIVDDPLTCEEFLNARSPAVLLPKDSGYQRIIADGLALTNLKLDQFSQIFIQIFSRGNPFRGSTKLHEKIQILITELLLECKLQALVLYGSPYSLDRLLPLLPSEMPWGFAYSQQPDAQNAVLKKLGFG